MPKQSKFWDKAEVCAHINLTDHSRFIGCGTPLCSGNEYHCRDCGVFITSCGCMSINGMDGWSTARRKWVEVNRNG